MKEFRVVTTKDEYIDSLLIRREVFCFEQNVSYEDELDFVDKDRIIINGYENGQVVATGRINFKERGAKFERICVLKDFRGKSWGKDLMLYMINFCLDEKLGKIVDELILEGQVQAMGFYEKLGFIKEGEMFYDAGIPHYLMRKKVNKN